MTMGDELFSKMALPVVIGPILEKTAYCLCWDCSYTRSGTGSGYTCRYHPHRGAALSADQVQSADMEQRDMASAQTLRAAFSKVEAQHPGFSYDLIRGLLRQADIQGRVDMTECLLRLEGTNNSSEFQIQRSDPDGAFDSLNERAIHLKQILSRIPDEIYNRTRFLGIIKDIASAIKSLLDGVNNVFKHIDGQSNKQALEQRKREFVKYSKKFSNTLKDFFRENQKNDVFESANHLIHQTNLIMKTVKESC